MIIKLVAIEGVIVGPGMGIRVLHLVDSGGLYGAEKMLLSLVQEQVKQGLEPMILSAGEPGVGEKHIEAEAKKKGLPVTTWRMKPGLNLKESWRILNWAQRNHYNLLHSHGFKFNVLLGLYPARVRRIKIVSTIHGYVHAKRFSKMWLYECLDRFVLRRMDGIVLVGSNMKKEITSVNPKKTVIRTIENGIDISAVRRKGEEKLEPTISGFISQVSPVFIGIGRLSREKGFDQLIEALSCVKEKLPRAGLILAGDGKQKEYLLELVKKNGCSDSVIFTGYYDNVPSLLNNADALVMPSLTEGLPITLLEAMAIKTPVIASSVGEIPAVLGFGSGGRVLEKGTVEEIKDAMIEVIEQPNDTANFKNWAFARVEECFSNVTMASRYHEFYGTILKTNDILSK